MWSTKLKFYFLKTFAELLAYTLARVFTGAAIGYFCGALVGLIMTFHNNNFLIDTSPQGSYLWWANALGYIISVFAVLPGAACGFLFGFIKISEQILVVTKIK